MNFALLNVYIVWSHFGFMLVARTHRQQTGDMSLPIVGIGLSERLQNYQASSDSVIVFETFFFIFLSYTQFDVGYWLVYLEYLGCHSFFTSPTLLSWRDVEFWKHFLATMEMTVCVLCFVFSICLYVDYIDKLLCADHPCISGMKPNWQWWMFLICSWICESFIENICMNILEGYWSVVLSF